MHLTKTRIRYYIRESYKILIQKIFYAIISLFFVVYPSYGQRDLDQITFLSPDAAKFVQYGNLDISHYTGQFKYSIPLYEYKDKDFSIPVELNYLSNGFTPGKPHGLVGLDWTLVCGGAITRQIVGSPDDKQRVSSTNWDTYLRNGWWVGLQTEQFSQSGILNISNNFRRFLIIKLLIFR